MNNKRYQGKIIKWKDDKGFGFLKTASIEKDIFLHISEIKNRQQQPKVGDTIYFELKPEGNGKLKAINASFTPETVDANQSTKNRSSYSNQQRRSSQNTQIKRSVSRNSLGFKNLGNLVFIVIIIAGGILALPKILKQDQSSNTASTNPTTQPPNVAQNPPPTASTSNTQNCNIKGNISYPDGEKLYHKPGYRDYDEVDIFENEGERWFCTEQEAINAGFKDAANQSN